MKANQKSLLANDTRAQVGIGTMIVFIATILVAATAAAVLIDTSGKLQERSSSTGTETTKQVASNLVLKQLYGDVASDQVTDLHIVVGLAPGASLVDLEKLKIVMVEGTKRADIGYEDTPNTCAGAEMDEFCLVEIRDPKNVMSLDDTAVIGPGGLAEITIDLSRANEANGLQLDNRAEVSLLLIPEVGSPLIADFVTPASYGSDSVVTLR